MRAAVIAALHNQGIQYRGDHETLSLFEGVGNRFKAAVDITAASDDEAVATIIAEVGKRRTEWPEAIEPEPTLQHVPMRTGPYGGLHVLVDGQWLRVRKEGEE